MPLKPGGGGLPQPYDPDNGQYTDDNKNFMRLKDMRALEFLKYTSNIPIGMEIHFPTKGIHEEQYCRMFVELYRDKFAPIYPAGSKINYLLTKKVDGDKSQKLNEWGYRAYYPEQLYNDIIKQTRFNTIKFSRFNQRGDVLLKAETILNFNRATSIWKLDPNGYKINFITLYTTGKVFDND